MTHYEYNALNGIEKYGALWGNGIIVGDRVEEEYKIILYQVFSFYVELYFHADTNALMKLRSFSSTEQLDVYIAQFDLKSIAGDQ